MQLIRPYCSWSLVWDSGVLLASAGFCVSTTDSLILVSHSQLSHQHQLLSVLSSLFEACTYCSFLLIQCVHICCKHSELRGQSDLIYYITGHIFSDGRTSWAPTIWPSSRSVNSVILEVAVADSPTISQDGNWAAVLHHVLFPLFCRLKYSGDHRR